MHVLLAWFAKEPRDAQWRAEANRRFDEAIDPLVPASYTRHESGGADWGITFLHASERGDWRWPAFESDGDTNSISLGVPVGLGADATPLGLARLLLSGGEVHAEVIPPFGFAAIESDRRAIFQQDWLGMCRLFVSTSGGMTVLSTRPSLIPLFLGQVPRPDSDGWLSFAAWGSFGENLSPYDGVRLLAPGERVSASRNAGWHVDFETGHSVDDVIRAGIDLRGRSADALIETAADGLLETAASITRLFSGELTLGLSGGKDSRLITASLIAAGHAPRLRTNEDIAPEGEIARRLVAVLRQKRGLELDHEVYRAAAEGAVGEVKLAERVRRVQVLYDYQFPASYIMRPAFPEQLPDAVPSLSLTGAVGEMATGYWYPPFRDAEPTRAQVEEFLARKLFGADSWLTPSVLAQERARFAALLLRGEALGLEGAELGDYAYLVERFRRWSTSAYAIGMVTPYLSPRFISATFAATPAQKRDRFIHTRLTERFVPEWEGIPLVGSTGGASVTAHLWDDDSLRFIHELSETAAGAIARTFRPEVVSHAIHASALGEATGRDARVLLQFACLGAASRVLEPESVRPLSRTYEQFLASRDDTKRSILSRIGMKRRT